MIGDDIIAEVFDHDQGTNGTFKLILDDPTDVFEVRSKVILQNIYNKVFWLGESKYRNKWGQLHYPSEEPWQVGLWADEEGEHEPDC